MPYQTGNGPRILDVFYSPNVYANNVPIALWLAPIPSPVVALPEAEIRALTPTETAGVFTSAAVATSAEEAESGLQGVGEVPQEGPVETVAAIPNTGNLYLDLSRNIDLALSEARSGSWKENGANTRILACYKSVGFSLSNDSTPWCAAFAGSILKKVGVSSLKSLSSLAYRGFGTSIPVNDKTKWRLNDIVIFTRNGGGHIGFFRGYNPANGSILVAGGNQSDNLTETSFRGSGAMPVAYVGRAWSVPTEYDKPVTYSGSAGSSNIKVV